MQERLLQFIWQHSLYNSDSLSTKDGETITVIHPGQLNANSGPDFLNARIRVNKTLLAGHIELHVNGSDWHKHGHQHDDAYKNIILHIVYNDDADAEGLNAPVLSLGNHIQSHIIDKYANLVSGKESIPCAKQLALVKDITKESRLSRLLAERWEEKNTEWKEVLQQTKGDWNNLLYYRMAANFGFKVNATPFLMLAQSLPLNVLAKHRLNLLQTEALLFGQAGMLTAELNDDYPKELKKEYGYLAAKYKLTPIPAHLWKFLRLRPANFPTIRIAQFAALVHKSVHLFSRIVETHTIKEIVPLLEVTASSYWKDHYLFDEAHEQPTDKRLGKDSVHNIIVNTIAPVQFLYAADQGTEPQRQKALELLDTVPAEKNKILDLWLDAGWKAVNAGQSQALIQLYNKYCSPKRCLECSIGLSVLKS